MTDGLRDRLTNLSSSLMWLGLLVSRGWVRRSDRQVEQILVAGEAAFRDALQATRGLIHSYVGIDRETGSVTNVSIWDSLAHAQAMSQLAPMLAPRPILQEAGVVLQDRVIGFAC